MSDITLNRIDGMIDKSVSTQRKWCGKDFLLKADYYKSIIKSIAWIIAVAVLLFGGVVGWSYRPIKEIAELKVEMRVVNSKLDHIIKMNGDK